MFGYINPDKPNMLMKDYALYRAYYCGVCKATGKSYGQFARFSTNYDIAFLSAFCHDYLNFVPEIKLGTCILNPVKKKDIVCGNPVMDKVVAANIITFYYKLQDDVLDKNNKGRAIVKGFAKSAYLKAKKMLPDFDLKMDDLYKTLRRHEEAEEKSVDLLSDCSAMMLAEACRAVICEDNQALPDNVFALAYNVGKWVYLADATDDLEEDFKKGCFNPLINSLGEFTNRKTFIKMHKTELDFLFNTCINSAIEALKKIPRGHSSGMIDNVIFRGLIKKTNEILNSSIKLRPVKV